MMNIGGKPLRAGRSVATSVGWAIDGRVDYVLEGNIHSTGDTIAWLRDGLGLIASSEESEALAMSVPDTNGVYLVPAFSGLGAPYWDNQARAAIIGMARNATKAHVVRAGLEAIAYQVRDLVDAMQAEAGVTLRELRADGGATKNSFLMQFQADILDVPVTRSAHADSSALGAAMMAGLTVGVWRDLAALAGLRTDLRAGTAEFQGAMDAADRSRRIAGWRDAVRRTLTRAP